MIKLSLMFTCEAGTLSNVDSDVKKGSARMPAGAHTKRS